MSATKQIPNIEFLGRTYDVVAMDPLALGNTSKNQNVFDWTRSEYTLSSIGDFSVPKNVGFTVVHSTHFNSETKTMSSSYEWQTSAKADVEVSTGLPGVFEFSASAGFKEMAASTSTRKKSFAYARAYNERHIVQLDLRAEHPDYPLTGNFKDAVAALPVESSDASSARYDGFIREFGTHLTTRVTLGGMAYQVTQAEASRYMASNEKEEEFKLQAKGVIESVSAGANATVATKARRASDVAAGLDRFEVHFLGGDGSTGGITDAWLASLESKPVIIKTALEPLSNVLNTRFFRKDSRIDEKAILLDFAIRKWVRSHGVPGSDTAPLRYGEQVVMILPLNDGTVQFSRTMGTVLQFTVDGSNRPDPTVGTSAALVMEPLERGRAGRLVLTGDKFLIKHVGSDRYAGPRPVGFEFTSVREAASVFAIFHEEDDIKVERGKYVNETDKVKMVFAAAPNGVITSSVGLAHGSRNVHEVSTKSAAAIRLVRTEWLD